MCIRAITSAFAKSDLSATARDVMVSKTVIFLLKIDIKMSTNARFLAFVIGMRIVTILTAASRAFARTDIWEAGSSAHLLMVRP